MSIRVLLADDHAMIRDGLRSILEREPDVEVVGEAQSGREAVRQATALHPDVVIMDVAMKDLNGIEATRQIKAALPNVAVIALSSHSDRRYVTSIIEAGAAAYLLKANAYDELKRAIHAVVDKQGYLCPEVAGFVVNRLREPGEGSGSAYKLLGAREREVLQLLAEGYHSPEIARRLHVSTSTVDTHRRNLMRKLDIHNVAELTKYAIREGLTPVE